MTETLFGARLAAFLLFFIAGVIGIFVGVGYIYRERRSLGYLCLGIGFLCGILGGLFLQFG